MLCEDKKCPVYIECMERLEALPYCASKAAELATTANQQLKAEIAALESRLRMVGCVSAEDTEELCSIREEMRQLSAV